ncbi:little elongation complex subunit 1 [Contarinia nasturtii]|uniref:little elongation complex subunit 1 n=1 Tax=Contarinia nasturtii TaxID=265458 RepID=UPI0012D38609|nr:little elongation complex subunit 1 [Contarinia nasturtii]
MESDPSVFLAMNDFSASPPSLSPFNMEILMSSIVNNDTLVRSYHEKCAETNQIQQNFKSFTETANQIQELYTKEKEQRAKLQVENADLIAKLNRVQGRLNELENVHINMSTLNNQRIAEFEDQIEKSNKKYLDLCESYVEQANIICINQLSNTALTRKCTAVKEYLLTNGVLFDWKSPSKQRRKSGADNKSKTTKTTRTFATQTDPFECDATPKPITCEKGTQYQQSKTTRSTCTSTFIQTTESSTNTDMDSDNEQSTLCIESALNRMLPHPLLLSPIREANASKVTTAGTQTTAKNCRTQGTLTHIHNVRKRVNYVRARTKSEQFYEVKKEENPSPCASPSPFCPLSQIPDDTVQLNSQFHHYWQIIGDVLCRMLAGQGNMLSVDEQQFDHIRMIQNLITEKGMYRKPIENNDLNDVHCAKGIDCNDDHSRDSMHSMESYNSDKIVFSQIRNLSNYSPLPDENSSCSMGAKKQNVFTPIEKVDMVSQTIENCQSKIESQVKRIEKETPNEPIISNKCEKKTNNNQLKTTFKRPLAHREYLHLNNRSSSVFNDSDDVQFKVPKRKIETTNQDLAVKKKKTNKVKAENAEQMKSLFGDSSDEDEQIEEILESFRVPEMLSPIKDLEYEPKSTAPLMPMDDTNEIDGDISHDPTHQSASQPKEIESHESSEIFDSKEPNSEEPEEPLHQFLESPSEPKLPIDNELQPTESESIECLTLPTLTEVNNTLNDRNTDNCDVNQQDLPISESNADEIPDFDDYSPASPKPEENTSTLNPPMIPLDTLANEVIESDDGNDISTESAFDQIIYNYTLSTRHEVMMPNFTNAECYLLASLRNAIEKYCLAKEWSSSTATECIDKLLSLSQLPKHLVTSILEVVEDTREDLTFECTPPAPMLPPSLQKCVLLVSRLTKLMPTFNKYIQFELERRLFTFEREKPITILTNLAHFYIAIVDIEQPSNRDKVRLFMYKCLYYYKISSIPLVFIAIMAHPFVLPHANEIEHNNDPLIRAIMSTLSNIIYTDNAKDKPFLKKNEMYHTLKRRYGFFADKLFPIDGVVDHCMECIRMKRLQHVDYALILIAKRKDYEYATKQIIEKHLLPMLHQLFSMNLNATVEHDETICTILFTIGSIVKTFPIEEDISGYINIFVTCLNATQRKSIQEAAVLAICQLSRFGVARIYQYLNTWKPNYQISPHIQTVLRTIVYRKSERFWFGTE